MKMALDRSTRVMLSRFGLLLMIGCLSSSAWAGRLGTRNASHERAFKHIEMTGLHSWAPISGFEHAARSKDGRFVVIRWSKGPRENELYRVVEVLPHQPDKPLGKGDFLAEADRQLGQMAEALRQRSSTPPVVDPGAFYDCVVSMHALYHGNAFRSGLDTMQWIDSDVAGLMHEMSDGGLEQWLINRLQAIVPDVLADSDGRPVKQQMFEFRLPQFYGMVPKLDQNSYMDREEPLALIHRTLSSSTSGILAHRALVADDYRDPAIPRVSGELADDPDSSSQAPQTKIRFEDAVMEPVLMYQKRRQRRKAQVSFFRVNGGSPENIGRFDRATMTGTSWQPPFAFPVLWAVSEAKAEGLQTTQGEMETESCVQEGLPLERISHVFVPYFATKSYETMLANHSYRLKVLPLGFLNGEPLWDGFDASMVP